MSKKRVLVVLDSYPTLSETYKENEIKYLYQDFEVLIASVIVRPSEHEAPYQQHFPYHKFQTKDELLNLINIFQPDIIHGHYLMRSDILHFCATVSRTFFTVRLHSFDCLGGHPDAIKKYIPFLNSDECVGVLAFPFLLPYLERLGVKASKLVADWPVVDYERFYDRSPNGSDILNLGACIPKKNIEQFVDIAVSMRERNFVYYPISYHRDKIIAYNEKMGSPVDIMDTVEPFEMPPIYKRSEWLLYTVNKNIPTVGWPMAIAEAQASGVGVLIQNIRPDLKEYVGGAGYVFDTPEEAQDVLSKPYPKEMREIGFEQARKSDIKTNIVKLHQLWGVSA